MKSLQHKIFFFFLALLVTVQVVALYSGYRDFEAQKDHQVELRLETAKSNFKKQFAERDYYLSAFAGTAARDFGLKQVFEEDTRSFLVALNNHRKRIDADLALAVSADGRVVGELIQSGGAGEGGKVRVGAGQDKAFSDMALLDLPGADHLLEREGEVYQISFAPLKSGDLVFGWVGFGYGIDTRLANRFAELTELATVFALRDGSGWRVLASSATRAPATATLAEPALVAKVMAGEPASEVIAAAYTFGQVHPPRRRERQAGPGAGRGRGPDHPRRFGRRAAGGSARARGSAVRPLRRAARRSGGADRRARGPARPPRGPAGAGRRCRRGGAHRGGGGDVPRARVHLRRGGGARGGARALPSWAP